jgi:nucleotide-binding universal stress UspA family protein
MLPVRTIVHATDFSECSEAAFRLACSVARDYGARLLVLHVLRPPTATAYEAGAVLLEPEGYRDELWEKLHRLQPRQPGVPVNHRLSEGDPAAEVLALARETGCDLIVVGTHGRTGLGRLLLGSVAEQVVRKAPCPVLTVKAPPPQAEPARQHGAEALEAGVGK